LIEGDLVDLGSASHSKALALMSVRVCGCGTTVLLALVEIRCCGGCTLLRCPKMRGVFSRVEVMGP
jgi:hypothetical protein